MAAETVAATSPGTARWTHAVHRGAIVSGQTSPSRTAMTAASGALSTPSFR